MESNKSNDSKFVDLKAKFDALTQENSQLQEKLAQTIEDMNA
jgi:hypothetical protein